MGPTDQFLSVLEPHLFLDDADDALELTRVVQMKLTVFHWNILSHRSLPPRLV